MPEKLFRLETTVRVAVSRQVFQRPGAKLIHHLLARGNMQRIRRPQADSYPV